MTTRFDRELAGFRFVETRYGDSLQLIAARELGDAARWIELISYNKLVAPFITDDPSKAGDGVLLTGGLIRVPAPVPVITSTIEPDQVFEADVLLERGMLMTENGDFAVVAGRDNLRQALKHRVDTEVGELIYHTDYGSKVRRVLGTVNGPTATLLVAQYAKAAVRADPRVARVTKSIAEASGDKINVSVEAEPVAGQAVQVGVTV